MDQAVIGYTNYYLPANYMTTDEYVEKLPEAIPDSMGLRRADLGAILKNSIGISKIYVEDRANEAKIFTGMLDRYFAPGTTKPEDIDFIIYTRGNSVSEGDPLSMLEEYCVNVPYYLQQHFKMTNARIFNVEQQCAGTLVALEIANSFIRSSAAKKILLLSGNFFQDLGHRLMGGLGLVSDAAGVMEVSASGSNSGPGLLIKGFSGVTDGTLTMVTDFKKGTNPANIVKVGSKLITSIARDHQLSLNDVSMIVPQNLSRSGWNFYCQLMNYPKDRVFQDSFSDGGHLADVDYIRNLTDIRRKKRLSPNEHIIFYGTGTGTSWNAMLAQAV